MLRSLGTPSNNIRIVFTRRKRIDDFAIISGRHDIGVLIFVKLGRVNSIFADRSAASGFHSFLCSKLLRLFSGLSSGLLLFK